MFSLFKKKNQADRLSSHYNKLMNEAHRLSTMNRRLSDEKYLEAQKISDQINALKS